MGQNLHDKIVQHELHVFSTYHKTSNFFVWIIIYFAFYSCSDWRGRIISSDHGCIQSIRAYSLEKAVLVILTSGSCLHFKQVHFSHMKQLHIQIWLITIQDLPSVKCLNAIVIFHAIKVAFVTDSMWLMHLSANPMHCVEQFKERMRSNNQGDNPVARFLGLGEIHF